MNKKVAKPTRFLIILLFLAGPGIGFVAYRFASQQETERAMAEFESLFIEKVFAFEKEILAKVESLQSLRSLFDTHDEVTRETFGLFTAAARSRHPAIQAYEWIPRVQGPDRQAHEERARSEGLPGYRITVKAANQEVQTAPESPEYYPVLFAEPMEGNESAIGYDLTSDEVRRDALERAVQTGEAALTDPIRLVQDKVTSKAFLLYLPVYQRHVPGGQPGPGQLRGLVLIVFRINEVMERSLLAEGRESSGLMSFELLDNDVNGRSMIIFSHAPDGTGAAVGGRASRKDFRLAGQDWSLVASPTPAFVASRLSKQSAALGLGSFLLWELGAGLLIGLVKWNREVTRRRQTYLLHTVLQSISDGVVVADRNGQMVLFNEAAKTKVGVGRTDLTLEKWANLYGCFLPDGETPYRPDQLPLVRTLRGEQVSDEEMFVRNPEVPDGRWISINGTPLLDQGTEPAGGVIVFRDITQHKKSQQTVELLSEAINQTDDTVFITDPQGTIEYVNPAFEATTGYTQEEALGKTPAILNSGMHGKEHFKQLWDTILAGKVYRNTTINRKKNRQLYHAEQTITPMKSGQGRITHFVSVVKDMSERRRIEEQEYEMQLASKVQKNLYPKDTPGVEGFDIAGAIYPAEATCGDYFDFLPLPDGSLGVVIGDVSGHGLGPALVMVETRSYLRSCCGSNSGLSDTFAKVNQVLFSDLEQNRYVTLLLARLALGPKCLFYANAGHTPGYLLDEAGAVKRELTATGIPLGMFANSQYQESECIFLDPGNLLVLITDGLTESQSPEGAFFESKAALETIRLHRQKPAAEIVEHLHDASREFAGGMRQDDDITIVVCKVL